MIRVTKKEAARLMLEDKDWTVKQCGKFDINIKWSGRAVFEEWGIRRGKVLVGAGKAIVWLDDVTWAERAL